MSVRVFWMRFEITIKSCLFSRMKRYCTAIPEKKRRLSNPTGFGFALVGLIRLSHKWEIDFFDTGSVEFERLTRRSPWSIDMDDTSNERLLKSFEFIDHTKRNCPIDRSMNRGEKTHMLRCGEYSRSNLQNAQGWTFRLLNERDIYCRMESLSTLWMPMLSLERDADRREREGPLIDSLFCPLLEAICGNSNERLKSRKKDWDSIETNSG